MRMSITSNIKFALPKTDSAKEFMKFVEECSQTTDKSLVGTLMSTLTTMELDGSRTMHEHVIEMTNIVARLKSIGMTVDENYNMLVQEETRLKKKSRKPLYAFYVPSISRNLVLLSKLDVVGYSFKFGN